MTAIPESHTTLLEAALGYARRGWPVFPVDDRRFLPDGSENPRWKITITELAPNAHKSATTDENTIRKWWSLGKWGIGVDLERAGLIVFDGDNDEAVKRFESQAQVRTNKGVHVYCERPKELKPRRRINIYRGTDNPLQLDILSLGYTILPPTPGYSLIRELEPLELDEMAIRALTKEDDGPTASTDNSGVWRLPDKVYGPDESSGPKGRNDVLFKYASRLRNLGLGEDAIYSILRDANAARCVPPLPDKEIHTIAGSAAKQEVDRDFLGREVLAPNKPASLRLALARDFDESIYVEPDWWLEDVLPKGFLTILCGAPGTGKSTWATWLAGEATKVGDSVLWIPSGEETSADIITRAIAHDVDLSKFWILDGEGHLTLPHGAEWLRDRLKELPAIPSLVYLDALFDHIPSGQDSAFTKVDAMREVLRSLRRTCPQATILSTIHLNRAGDYSGTTATLDVARSFLWAHRDSAGVFHILRKKLSLPHNKGVAGYSFTTDLRPKVNHKTGEVIHDKRGRIAEVYRTTLLGPSSLTVEAAIGQRNDSEGKGPGGGRSVTLETAVLEFARQRQGAWPVQEAIVEVQDRFAKEEAEVPSGNSIRTAIAKMVSSGAVAKVGRGLYEAE